MSKGPGPRYFPAAAPLATENGIRAKSARGKIASTWWSTRFIEVLEASGMGSRLTRGRNYARRGQVISLDLTPGQVTARVQGSRSRPYSVRIGITAYGKADWARVEERLCADAWFVAQLLAGEMPPDIEQVFAELGLALFPSDPRDLSLDCSCPDWGVPCKHLAAVFYLLAERFDEDPFDVLAWRGRHREDLLARLDASRRDSSDATAATVPLTELLDVFYLSPGGPQPQRPTASGTNLLEELPPVPVTVRKRPLPDILKAAYDQLVAPTQSADDF